MKDKDEVKEFLVGNLKAKLQEEMEAYVTLQKTDAYDAIDLITYNEIALLSLVKSALVRGKDPNEVWAMQEYNVYAEDKYKGRGDLFVMFRGEQDQDTDLLIEAKRDGLFVPKRQKISASQETRLYLDDTMKQALRYLTAERAYYIENTYIVTMFFAHLEHKHLKDYKEEVVSPPEKLYYEFDIPVGNKLLFVYGEIQPIKSHSL